MELKQLKTFRTVAKTLSFHRTAEILNYAQSTVSAQIRALEDNFGVPLFDRLGKRISLTDAGQKLMHYAERLLDMEEETLTEMSDVQESQGRLSIRIPQTLSTYYFPEILSLFKQKYPKVGFDIKTCVYHSLQQELKTGVTDLAFLFAEDVYAPELISDILGHEDIVMIVHPSHALASAQPNRARDLKNEALLLPKHDCAYKMNLEQILAQKKIKPAAIMEFNSIESIKHCVLKNLGIGLVPQIMVKNEINEGGLVVLTDLFENMSVEILMLRHRNKWLSPMLHTFIQATREVFSNRS